MEQFKQIRENLLDMLEDIDEKLGKITEKGSLANKNLAKEKKSPSVVDDDIKNDKQPRG